MKKQILVSPILMDYCADFSYHNVGQGLFYSGVIISNDTTRLIYDCGSINMRHLEGVIDKYKKENSNKFDFIIISHLHADHTNGLNRLLNDKNETAIVFVPYFNPIERLAILAITEENQEEWWYDFIADPVKFFLIEKKISKIVFISHSDETPIDKDIEITSINNSDDNVLLTEIRNNENWDDYINSKAVIAKKHNFNGTLSKLWQLKFYTHPRKSDKFHKKIEELLSSKGIRVLNAIKNKKIVKEIADTCYTEIYKSDLNQTSLMMYHSPISYKGNIKISCSAFSEDLIQNEDRFGQLLTGDISFVTNWSKILKYFKDEFENILIVQIPHHGSLSNWKSKNSIKFDCLVNIKASHWINSSSIKKKKYPHPAIISLLDEFQYNLHCCNEYNSINIKYLPPLYQRKIKIERILTKVIRKSDCDICKLNYLNKLQKF